MSLHERALEASMRYKRAESDLIEILIEVEKRRSFLERGHSSLFKYVVNDLKLSKSVAYNLIAVARRVRQVPELGLELRQGRITLSNAKRIVPVLTSENQSEWLEKAAKLSQKKLEREVARVRPEIATPERASYVTSTRVRLELGLSESNMLRLRRVQDLLCQARRRPVSLEETLVAMTNEHLKRHDPLEKAKRHVVRKSPVPENPPPESSVPENPLLENPSKTVDSQVSRPVRRPIPRSVHHRVSLRDERRCTFPGCNQTRWLEIHHKIPVAQGGTNELSNLITLCSAHHSHLHSQGS